MIDHTQFMSEIQKERLLTWIAAKGAHQRIHDVGLDFEKTPEAFFFRIPKASEFLVFGVVFLEDKETAFHEDLMPLKYVPTKILDAVTACTGQDINGEKVDLVQ